MTVTPLVPPTHSAPTDRPATLPTPVWWGMGIAFGCAAVLSFASLRHFADVTGTGWVITPLFPCAIDVTFVVAIVVWLRADRPDVAYLACWIMWVEIAISVGGNAADHGYLAAHATPPWGWAVAVGAVAPLSAAALTHLAILATRPQPTATQGATQNNPDWTRQVTDADWSLSRRKLAQTYGVTEGQARAALARRAVS